MAQKKKIWQLVKFRMLTVEQTVLLIRVRSLLSQTIVALFLLLRFLILIIVFS